MEKYSKLLNDKPEIPFEKSEPGILKDINILKYALLENEFSCLKIAFVFGRPTNTAEFYHYILIDRFNIYAKSKIKILETNKKPDIERVYNLANDGLLYNSRFEQKSFTSQDCRVIETILRKDKINFPSFHSVKKALDSLKEYGFLIDRLEKSGNTKTWWYINPTFLLKYGDKFKRTFWSSKIS